jgi:hypothetical protein
MKLLPITLEVAEAATACANTDRGCGCPPWSQSSGALKSGTVGVRKQVGAFGILNILNSAPASVAIATKLRPNPKQRQQQDSRLQDGHGV